MYYGVRLPVERAGTHPFAFGLHRSRQVARGIPDEVRIFPSSPFLHPSFAARACIGPLHGVDTDEVDGRTIAVSTFVGGCPPYDDVVARIQKKKKKGFHGRHDLLWAPAQVRDRQQPTPGRSAQGRETKRSSGWVPEWAGGLRSRNL